MTRLRSYESESARRPRPSAKEVKAWLAELERLKNERGDPEEIRLQVLEHIEMAVVYLGWSDKTRTDGET